MHMRLAVPVLASALVIATLLPATGQAQQGGPATPPPTIPVPTPVKLPSAAPPSGIIVPDAARSVLTQQELVEGVCLVSRWRAEELYAAVDAVAATQGEAQAALDAGGVKYQLPNHAEFRTRADNALAAICSAPTVDRAMALTGELFQVNIDMEAKYGALSEAMGGDIQRAIQAREDKIRGDVSTFANGKAKEAEASLRAEAESLAEPIVASVKPKYEAQITERAQALAAALAPSAKSEAAVRAVVEAQLQPFIDQKVAEAKAEVTTQLEGSIKTRIDNSKAQITAEANKMADALAQTSIVIPWQRVQRAFDAMLSEVERRVEAARTADSPAKRAAVDARVRLAMKTTDAYLGQARASIEAARAELAALKAANPRAADADALLARLDSSRATLERDLRAAANAGDEAAFNAAYMGFEAAWREIAAEVDAAAGVWTAARVCQEANPALARALSEADAAGGEVGAALASVTGVAAGPGQEATAEALRTSLNDTQSAIGAYTAKLRALQQSCASPAGDARPLIAALDAARRDQEAVRQAYEASRLLAQSLNR
ncbi:MAG: hypothetical protein WC211_08005 [Dehalococcoidia bacterium]